MSFYRYLRLPEKTSGILLSVHHLLQAECVTAGPALRSSTFGGSGGDMTTQEMTLFVIIGQRPECVKNLLSVFICDFV